MPRFFDQISAPDWRGLRQESMPPVGVMCIVLMSWFEWWGIDNKRWC